MDTRIILAIHFVGSLAACQVPGPSVSGRPNQAPPMAAEAPQATSSKDTAESASLTLVDDRSLVCMVNNQFMGRPQIPITVDGQVYYGCCEMCKGRLANDPAARSATDPVSGRAIDKAVAVIGRTKTGATLYFENQKNFATYSQQVRVQ